MQEKTVSKYIGKTYTESKYGSLSPLYLHRDTVNQIYRFPNKLT